MNTFRLQIVTPDGEVFNGQATRLIVRTNNGDVAIMARHADYVAVLGMGAAVVVTESERKNAACMNGMLSVSNGEVTVLANAFEWAEQIDKERARAALDRAEAKLADSGITEEERYLSEMGEKLAYAHLSDVNERGGMCLPGKGEFDFQTLIKRLKDVGFDGALLIEAYTGDYKDVNELKIACDYLNELLYKNNCLK